MLVDEDAAALPDLQPRRSGQRAVGADADRGEDHVGGQLRAVVERHGALPHLGDRGPQPQVEAVLAHQGVDGLDHLGVEGGHDLGRGLDEGDLQAAVDEVLRDLEADGAADDDHGGAGALDRRHDRVGVLDVAQDEGALHAGHGRADGDGARGQDEDVVAPLLLPAGGEVPDAQHVPVPVGVDDLVAHPDVEAEPGAQGLRGVQEQRGALLDDAAHVVEQAAVGEGHVAAALVHPDLGVLQQSAQTGGRGHSAGDAAHDDDSHAVMLTAPLRPPRGPPARASPVS